MSQSTSPGDDDHVDEEVKMAVKLCLERFQNSEDRVIGFPSCFSGAERAYAHQAAHSLGFFCKSKGRGTSRFLTVWKQQQQRSDEVLSILPLSVSPKSLSFISSQLHKFPVRQRDCTDVQPSSKNDNSLARYRPIGHLNNSVPLVPRKRTASDLDAFRRSLPIYESRDELVGLIRTNRVVLVVGDSGCGKTTQIPQLLLDDCCARMEPCRILCTQPRRLNVVAVAKRVAEERGESVGRTVGYHVRLECRFSRLTLLTFCTIEVLLKTLMTGDDCLKNVTHVIVDEVHQRDALTDVLLTKMQSVLPEIPSLRLILASAALDVPLIRRYFGSCPAIYIKGQQFEVHYLYLEDVLKLPGFKRTESARRSRCDSRSQARGAAASTTQKDSDSEETELGERMDNCLYNVFYTQDQDSDSLLDSLILSQNVNVDYRHSVLGATALMVAASRGLVNQMEQLLIMGADVNMRTSNGWTALDFAQQFGHRDAVDLLRCAIPLITESSPVRSTDKQSVSAELNPKDQELLDDILLQRPAGLRVDLDLVMDLLHHICTSAHSGAVLIFLPGHDEIVSLCYRIRFDDHRFSSHPDRFQIFTLHSDITTQEQKDMLTFTPPETRRIILSTSVTETSITIDNVVFVIDTGLVDQKCMDPVSGLSTIKKVSISRANALQRRQRAGRSKPGTCFHLFSRTCFDNMREFQLPQLQRIPLQELCLQIKLLARSRSVTDFLSRAPEPPLKKVVTDALNALKVIGAMDQDGDLTDLGFQLSNLPIEPHLGKMVLSAVFLRCLDPVLTIASTLTYRDPFILPAQGTGKRVALLSRRKFSSCSASDHMALLTAFQAWQKARCQGKERAFCEKNLLSQSTMEVINGIRTQLVSHLRAIGFVRAHGGCDIHELNRNSENWAVVKAALVAGIYPNVLHVDQDAPLPSIGKDKLCFHPTSVLNTYKEKFFSRSSESPPSDWVIYDEMRRGMKTATVRCCSLVTPVTVAIFGGCALLPLVEHARLHAPDCPKDDSDSGSEDIADLKLDERLAFQLEPEGARLILKLRQMWQSLFLWRNRYPSRPLNKREESVLQTLISVLTEEEQRAGLQQPTKIGQRPRVMKPGEWLQASTPQKPTSSAHEKCGDALQPEDQLCDDMWTSCSVKSDSLSTSSSSSSSSS